jgi:hypothetical protein
LWPCAHKSMWEVVWGELLFCEWNYINHVPQRRLSLMRN